MRLGWPAHASADADSLLPAISSGLRPPLPAGTPVDQSAHVAAGRLDQLVARNYPDFNVPAVLPAFDPARLVRGTTWNCTDLSPPSSFPKPASR